MRTIILALILCFAIRPSFGQNNFESDPIKARFITHDISNFWKAFDQLGSSGNPFRDYLKIGSVGLKDFIPYRIENPRNLKRTVEDRKSDYERIRKESHKIAQSTDQIKEHYTTFKELYEEAIFPPTYFVIGAFNSGGTSSKNGLIIGVEMQSDIKNIPYIVSHELIHFNQNYPSKEMTLLEQSIKEGSADFIGKLISGKHINESAATYGNANEEILCSEFIEIMDDNSYHGWLYGSKDKKEGRPNDLGYWIGYKICESYYIKASNKKQAISDILKISDFKDFLIKSGYLAKYLNY
ncbi:DUF2268 domain-containing putative Zn-dependent protease [Reichenbachiella sp.]|uniref:DUF2268 domain-containing putative Zn-dependent protease n=1 Tax=Reichenbachiella sp. TaxID=2184521 RepID=UPI003296D29D